LPNANTIPERLTAFKVYLDGTNDLKGIADLQLPKFESLKDTVRGAGILGEYESPTPGHFGSMKVTLNWRTIAKDQLLLLKKGTFKFDCRGAFQDMDAATMQQKTRAVRILVQGPTMSVDAGKFETGTNTSGSSEIEVLYIKIDIDGANVIELDKLNFKFIVDGEDQLAEIRAALGM
jgi:P2 family phage contractile tail tube protein